jgi:preprotein translocase subunit YajC
MQTNSLMQILNSFTPLLLITFIFIFFVFRPQYKKASEHKKMLASLKIGDKILTTSGLIGKIIGIDGELIELDISSNENGSDLKIKIIKNSILELFDEKKFKNSSNSHVVKS